MTRTAESEWLAGVDGCPGGWIAAFMRGDEVRIEVLPRFADVLARGSAIVAVDIPIGLPERAGTGGRAAENAVRPLLGARQSSVFSVPSRAAIYAPDYATACATALATSDPPRKVSKQLFNLASKIREVDQVLRADAALASRAEVVNAPPPKGAGPDDLLDALACAYVARRLHRGEAVSFPAPPERDPYGLPMAIWA